MAVKVKLKNVSGALVVCCQVRIKPNETVELDEKKFTEALAKLVQAGTLAKV